jgi:hypothetical protein
VSENGDPTTTRNGTPDHDALSGQVVVHHRGAEPRTRASFAPEDDAAQVATTQAMSVMTPVVDEYVNSLR